MGKDKNFTGDKYIFWDNPTRNNQLTYLQYYNRLTELAITTYEWTNLPDTIDERFMELCLYSDGMAVFFYDEVIGYLCLQCMIGGELDVYRVPTIRTAYATNGYNMPLDQTNSVIIFNNNLRTNNQLDIIQYANRLNRLERTIDVNVNAQKTPIILKGTENQRMSVKNLSKQYDGNEPFIIVDKDMDLDSLKAIQVGAPYVADKLNTLKKQIWTEALTYLGIDNANTDKKERLISDEVVSNLGAVEAQRFTRLNARKRAADQINKMFGLNIGVEFREGIKTMVREETELEQVYDSD